jgi:hypothetical protein
MECFKEDRYAFDSPRQLIAITMATLVISITVGYGAAPKRIVEGCDKDVIFLSQ